MRKTGGCTEKLEKEAHDIVKKMKDNPKWSSEDYSHVNLCYNCFIAMQKNGVFSSIAKMQMEAIDTLVNKQVEQLEKGAMKDLSIEAIVPWLLLMKQMSVRIFSFKDTVNKRIDELLGAFKRQHKDGIGISVLALKLEKDTTGVGEMIVAEHNAFKGYNVALFNVKTQAHDVEYVLRRMDTKGDIIDAVRSEKLANKYKEFKDLYTKLVHGHLDENNKLTTLVNNTKMITRSIEQKPGAIQWDAGVRGEVVSLVAHVFALWTLQNAQFYFDAKGVENQNSYLLQPHPAQVISIFRMLGIDESKKELISNLIQIGTGEGKSVTLAVTSCVLALLGFDVSCASYSEYLSCRDFKSFEPLFSALSVTDYIHYGTFNKLCERIINEGGDVRKLVESMIMPDDEKKSADTLHVIRAKVLLIDEVDVFFNKEFYGSCYSPAATLRHDSITKLVDYIWNNKKSFLKLRDVKQSNEYKECCKVLKEWETLLDEAIKDMLDDIQKFESHRYQVSNDKIGYKEQDSICYNVRYGYKTLFAYYHEHAQNKISNESFKNNICISFRIGNFSYAEVPKSFCCIMGVSGTLKTLSAAEQEVVEKVYHVSKHTYIPSLFGDNKLIFADQKDIFIVEECDYFTTLKKEIDDRLVGKNPDTKRAVLVFFESKKQLIEFYESSNFVEMKRDAIVMTEENINEEKEYLIKRATTSGQVGLFTRAFGRGTDFTFLSEELSEEVQIKGRTARQDIDNARSIGNFYPLLHSKRTEFFKAQYAESKQYVEYAANEHKLGEELIAALKRNDAMAVKKMLCDRNKGAEEKKLSQTIVLMDGTASMAHLLQKAKNTVCTMFERISTILKENGESPNSFEIQFVVYRNYNAPEDMLLKISPWESKPENLRNFMETVVACYGWGNEAIEIGLAHVNQEAEKGDVSQVILIGDAPANTRQEVIDKKSSLQYGFGIPYWKKTKLFSESTYYEDELIRLKQRKIPVHAFYINDQAKKNFIDIATITNGRHEKLDINSPQGSSQLTNLVSEEVLRNIGGSKGSAFVDAYRAKFLKSFTL
ncbi:hypothetical protein RFI_26400 [Reticulomyxa filosa]|uniref:SecA DEAD-like N-terminal domain-containing protein n=1 Tax=Reticulomyxa filosa TaxID=46433 RepID=X6MBE3_RETFI|nr:hypothetical protein RFI_26400 [Reticulomyxa filosa]|eukprot:ETO10976.1 hypothetical protein RFI_26400 [Reticulomyxa filosa]